MKSKVLPLALLATAAPLYAMADETPADDKSSVEGVVVTARAHDTVGSTASKLATPLVETPQSVSIITGEKIDQLGLTSLNQAMRYVAGVTPETRGGSVTRYDQFKLRGFDVTTTFLDGLSSQYPGWYADAQVDAASVERIEILKGPASVLYGNSPPGGLLNFVSKTPQAVAGGEAELRFGSRDLIDASIDTTGPIAGDPRYTYRLLAIYRQGDGQAQTTEYERILVAPSFTWRPDDATTVTILGRYQHDPKSNSYGSAPSKGSAFANPLGQLEPDFYDGDPNFEAYNRSQVQIGYLAEHRFNDVFAVHQNLRYTRVEANYESVYAAGLAADNRTLSRGTAASLESNDGFAVDNQLSAHFTTGALTHDVLLGVDYQHMMAKVQFGLGTAPDLDIFAPVYGQTILDPRVAGNGYYSSDSRIKQEQIGYYAQDQIKYGKLVTLLSLRRDDVKQETLALGAVPFPTTIDQGKTTGRVGVLYHFDNGFAPYASWSQSFEPQGQTDFAGRPFDPVTGNQIEGGVKYESPDKRIYATLAAFEIKRKNALTADPDHLNFSVQGGELRSRGVEFEGRAKLTDRVKLTAAATKLDVEYTKSNDGLLGLTPVGVAEKTASVFVDYDFPGALDGLAGGLGVRYVGPSWGDTANTFKSPSYTLVDLTLSYELGRLNPSLRGWQAAGSATNLFDKRYVSSCYSADWCWFGEQRTVQVGLKRSW
ncbi:MAG: TonB-dependent siderophore receptor [Caulobacter sp.]|nr:TonB-dependent siderophore receptor [Caulobacter sp.]